MSYAGPAVRGTRVPVATSAADPGMALAAGITIGLVVGAGAVLLFAPRSGEDTRHAIARSGRHLARRGRDAWSDLRYELRRYERKSRRRREASSL
jgi:hypothetical protein